MSPVASYLWGVTLPEIVEGVPREGSWPPGESDRPATQDSSAERGPAIYLSLTLLMLPMTPNT
jgi:hypothetical protein